MTHRRLLGHSFPPVLQPILGIATTGIGNACLMPHGEPSILRSACMSLAQDKEFSAVSLSQWHKGQCTFAAQGYQAAANAGGLVCGPALVCAQQVLRLSAPV